MKAYKVNVNGHSYEITLEVIDKEQIKSAPASEAAPKTQAPSGGETVTAPMPGNILSVNIKVGDTVKKGDVLMVLEAMKMENEIMSPCDGEITFVGTSKGSTVNTGTVLCSIK